MARYTYDVFKNIGVVHCTSSYEGKPVIGIAKCDPRDTFDEEIGKKLAKLRCDLKVAQKRVKRANNKELEKRKALSVARDEHADACDYLYGAILERDDAAVKLAELTGILYGKTE